MDVYQINEGCFVVTVFQSRKGKVSLQGGPSECLEQGLTSTENININCENIVFVLVELERNTGHDT